MKKIIFLDRNALYIFGGDIKNVLSLEFDPKVVRDLEVINDELLETQLSEILQKNKVSASEALIVMGNSFCLLKEVPAETKEEEFNKIKDQFLEYAPFEETVSNVYNLEKKKIILAANKGFIVAVKKILENKRFTVEGVTSLVTLYPQQAPQFSTNVAKEIEKHYSSLRQASFSIETKETLSTNPIDDFQPPEKENDNKRVYILGGIFLFLIVILVGLLWYTRGRDSSTKTTQPVVNPTRSTTAIPTVLTSPTVTTAPVNKSLLSITILNGSGIPGQADDISSLLEENGYENIETGNSPTIQSSSTQIVYKSTVPVTIREEIIQILTAAVGDVRAQMNDEITEDIRITTSSASEAFPRTASTEASQE